MGTVSETPKKEEEKSDKKVVQMIPTGPQNLPKLSPEEQEIMNKAKEIAKKKQIEQQEQADAIIIEIAEKFDLTQDKIDKAIKIQGEISNPETGITNIVEAIEYYNKANLTRSQILFLAVNSSSQANYLQQKLSMLGAKLESVSAQLVSIRNLQNQTKESKEES